MDDDAHEYRRTLFDRHGPAAADYLRAGAYGLLVFGLVFGASVLEFGRGLLGITIGVAAGCAVAGSGLYAIRFIGAAWHHVMYSGASTPYEEQFSREQALVMQGRPEDALAAYERAIGASPHAIDPRIRAAELYAACGQPERAAALLREVQRLPGVAEGTDVYVSNRLVDLLLGPLHDPGRALVELRRIIDRYPATRAAEHARTALSRLKSELQSSPRANA